MSAGGPSGGPRRAVARGPHRATARESRLEHVLFACDEMAGFVTAAALVRPSKSLLDLEAKSVVKRMKEKAFARAVSRDDLRKGAEEIGLPLEEHAANVIAFMREKADELGLRAKKGEGLGGQPDAGPRAKNCRQSAFVCSR